MGQELLQAQIDVDASPERVWALISDLSLMPKWSPQCRMMKTFGPVRQGAKTVNLNRRKFMFWPTTCQLTEVIPNQKLAFRVNENNTVWSYELQPIEGGTRVVESRHAENGIKASSNFLVNAMFGGVPNFEEELVDGMNASLGRIKAAAEATARPAR